MYIHTYRPVIKFHAEPTSLVKIVKIQFLDWFRCLFPQKQADFFDFGWPVRSSVRITKGQERPSIINIRHVLKSFGALAFSNFELEV